MSQPDASDSNCPALLPGRELNPRLPGTKGGRGFQKVGISPILAVQEGCFLTVLTPFWRCRRAIFWRLAPILAVQHGVFVVFWPILAVQHGVLWCFLTHFGGVA